MSMNRRLVCLERTARSKSPSGLGATGEPRPEIFGRYEATVEEFRAALQAAKAPGVSRVPETPEMTAAHGEMLRAREELRAFAHERRDGES